MVLKYLIKNWVELQSNNLNSDFVFALDVILRLWLRHCFCLDYVLTSRLLSFYFYFMVHLITILLFITIVVNLTTTIGWFIGYQLQVDNPTCKEDVQNVRKNKLVLKVISLITTVLLITCLILFQIFFV